MNAAERFFYEHAGWSYHPETETPDMGRARGARRLAAAEQWAEDEGLEYVWEGDPDCGPDDFDFPEDKAHVAEYGAVGCILYRPCDEHGTDCKHAERLASLWGITESLNNAERDNYRRVIQAELALGAMPAEGDLAERELPA